MKKNKLLLPLASLTAAIGVATPVVTLTSCNKEPEITVDDVLNIDSDGVLYGFKDDVTDNQIKTVFGDTFIIPKKVTSIARYAFCNANRTTIPSFIKHFKFEDGYQCKVIEEYAFAYNPFESIEFTNERNHPTSEESPEVAASWALVDGGWGLKRLATHSFYHSNNLTKLTACSSIEDMPKEDDLPYLFGWDEWSEVGYINKTNINYVDFSDCVFGNLEIETKFISNWIAHCQQILGYGLQGNTKVHIFDESTKGTIKLRSYDTNHIYGPSCNEIGYFNDAVRKPNGLSQLPSVDSLLPDNQYIFSTKDGTEGNPTNWNIEYTNGGYFGE